MKLRIPRTVWVLGFVSLLMDISSEMIHSLLPLFLVNSLGLSVLAIGVIDGIAESSTLFAKVFSGILSDYFGRRKHLAVLGYGLSALTKPLFAIATSATGIFAARFLDRLGKGIRGAPRDALIADVTPAEIRGAAFGLRQSLDTVGALVGPLLATLLMLLWVNDFRRIFWLALIPGVLAFLLLLLGVKEAESGPKTAWRNPISKQNILRLKSNYWWVVMVGALLTLARFSEAFLVLHAQQLSLPLPLIPLAMALMNLVYALGAYPFGKWSDRVSQSGMLAVSLVVLVLADLILALSTNWLGLLCGFVLWGLHLALSQGLLASMIAASAPADLRGTAFGLFNLVSGVAMLCASVLAGVLWQSFGGVYTFYMGAGFAVFSLFVLTMIRQKRN